MLPPTRTVIFAATIGLLAPAALGSDTWFVNGAGSASATGQSWVEAFSDLQAALAVADSGDQIWVAAGTYRPSTNPSDVTASFLLKDGVEMYGGFAGNETAVAERDLERNVTVLSGDLADDDDPVAFKAGHNIDDNSGHVVTAIDVGPTCVLDGFTITAGIGRNLDGACDPLSGGGLAIIDGSPVVRNCTLLVNRANYGGGCYVGGSSSPRFSQCDFAGNFSKANGPGAIYLCDASISLDGCRFDGNGFNVNNSGGAILMSGAVAVIRGCEFINNQSNWAGGAVQVLGNNSEVLIEDTRFLGNRAYFGGALHAASTSFQFTNDVTVKDSLFSGNESAGSYAGAIWIDTSAVTIENCTIVGNRSYFTSLGAGIVVEGLSPEVFIKNTLVWGNLADRDLGELSQIWNDTEFFDVKVEHSCIQGLGPIFKGNGNIGDDPLLVNPTGLDGTAGTPDDDLRLSPDSPCVDAGDPASSGAGLDLSGMPRRLDGNLDAVAIVDIGAHEFGNVHLHVDGNLVPGGTVTVAVDSAVPLLGYLVVARSPGWEVLEPFGPALFDLDGSWVRVYLGVLPYEQAFSVPSTVPAAFDLTLQAFGIHPASGAGNTSNSVEMAFAP